MIVSLQDIVNNLSRESKGRSISLNDVPETKLDRREFFVSHDDGQRENIVLFLDNQRKIEHISEKVKSMGTDWIYTQGKRLGKGVNSPLFLESPDVSLFIKYDPTYQEFITSYVMYYLSQRLSATEILQNMACEQAPIFHNAAQTLEESGLHKVLSHSSMRPYAYLMAPSKAYGIYEYVEGIDGDEFDIKMLYPNLSPAVSDALVVYGTYILKPYMKVRFDIELFYEQPKPENFMFRFSHGKLEVVLIDIEQFILPAPKGILQRLSQYI